MKKIKVDITKEEYENLKLIAEGQESTVAKLVGAFIQDLTWSTRSGGSDERQYANDWLRRTSLKYR